MDLMTFIQGLFSSQDIIFRFGLLILIALYGLFALILAIQVNNLNRVVNQIGFSSVLNVITFLHLIASLALLGATVLFL